MKRKDWNLLVLAAAEGKPLTPVQLQKILFLIEKNVPQKQRRDFYNFKPYDYGPFDVVVYQDAEALEQDGFICIRPVPERQWSEYAATPAGLKAAEQLQKGLAPGVKEYIQALVEWASKLSFQEIVSAIYKAYPAYKEKSVFQE